jgi:hypothetical protein
MKIKVALMIAILALAAGEGYSHLCNDVFAQAKDNLAVKVDVRDGQLRISQNAKFRVYVLNTMDQTIQNIMLTIESKEFNAKVSPGSTWKGTFPALESATLGGVKQYFEVELTRKPGTPEGKYKIGLKLHNGNNSSMVFKTVDIEEAMSLYAIPVSKNEIVADGNVKSDEWGDSFLCSTLYDFVDNPDDTMNPVMSVPSKINTRFRFVRDEKNLYCMVDFQNLGKTDIGRILVAPDSDTAPNEIVIDMKSKKARFMKTNLTAGFTGTKAEIMIPLSLINAKGGKSILMNIVRESDNKRYYWKGNLFSYKNPIVYGVMSIR